MSRTWSYKVFCSITKHLATKPHISLWLFQTAVWHETEQNLADLHLLHTLLHFVTPQHKHSSLNSLNKFWGNTSTFTTCTIQKSDSRQLTKPHEILLPVSTRMSENKCYVLLLRKTMIRICKIPKFIISRTKTRNLSIRTTHSRELDNLILGVGCVITP